MNPNKNKNVLIIVLLLLIISNVFFIFKIFGMKSELKQSKEELGLRQTNQKIIEFNKLFIQNVLQSKDEVSFETRLKLENAVRDLADEEILKQWQEFTESKTEEQAQKEVKNLLEMLANKVIY